MLYTIEVNPIDFSLIDEVKKLPANTTSVVFKASIMADGKYYTLQNKSTYEIAEAFKNLPKTVRKVDCRNNGLGNLNFFALKHIFSALSCSITHFNLRSNQLNTTLKHQNRGDLSLLESLPPSITTLDLSNNDFEADFLQYALIYLHRNVINLNLSHNELGYEGIIKILDWLKPKSVKQLDLTYNDLNIPTDTQWISLWENLPPSLEQLVLGHEPLRTITCSIKQENDKPILSHLKHLEAVNVNPFRQFDLTKWIPCLPQNLISLSLRDSLDDNASLQTLFEVLPQGLQVLSIESNDLRNYSSYELEMAFSRINQNIIEINLNYTNIFYERSGKKVQQIFSSLQQLKTIHLNGFEYLSAKDIQQLDNVFPNLQTLHLDEMTLKKLNDEELKALRQAFSHVPNIVITASPSSTADARDKHAMGNLARQYGFKTSVASLVALTSFFIASHKIKTVDQKGQKLLTSGMDELVEGIKSNL
ncbi:hypothetical protein [Legionella brunensis]|uniref:Leucine-rich repeat protein n=1 Tax=Legionella brunensis TaxID=29422 RepID=A0A0W0SU72_9GAMM|nr:hypothetical protein [Legionella brunensis]KTC86828.1 Leucine-rich repeat protein [Legionella brunensis]